MRAPLGRGVKSCPGSKTQERVSREVSTLSFFSLNFGFDCKTFKLPRTIRPCRTHRILKMTEATQILCWVRTASGPFSANNSPPFKWVQNGFWSMSRNWVLTHFHPLLHQRTIFVDFWTHFRTLTKTYLQPFLQNGPSSSPEQHNQNPNSETPHLKLAKDINKIPKKGRTGQGLQAGPSERTTLRRQERWFLTCRVSGRHIFYKPPVLTLYKYGKVLTEGIS